MFDWFYAPIESVFDEKHLFDESLFQNKLFTKPFLMRFHCFLQIFRQKFK